jgi:hypothetical protein
LQHRRHLLRLLRRKLPRRKPPLGRNARKGKQAGLSAVTDHLARKVTDHLTETARKVTDRLMETVRKGKVALTARKAGRVEDPVEAPEVSQAAADAPAEAAREEARVVLQVAVVLLSRKKPSQPKTISVNNGIKSSRQTQ